MPDLSPIGMVGPDCGLAKEAAEFGPDKCRADGLMTAVSTGSVPAKQCTDCGQVLPSSEFYWVSKSEHRRANGAHRIRLKPCTRGPKERMAKGKICQACKPWASYAKSRRRFDLTPADYVAILQAQGGVCYICYEPPQGQRLH